MRAWLDRLLRAAAARLDRLLRLAAPVLDRIAAVGLIQYAIILAAQAFLALFPLVIAVIALAPPAVGQTLSHAVRARLGLTGPTGAEVEHLVATRDDLRSGITVFGALVVLASATSFTRALQRVYENAWQVPRLGLRGSLRGLAWLLSLVAYLTVLGVALRLTASPAPAVSLLRLGLVLAGQFLLWWMTPFLLLCGRAKPRALILTGALTAAALAVAGAVSGVVLPRIIGNNERQFGTIGTIFAVESWLVVIAGIIVAAAVLGALAAQAGGPVGRWVRGSPDPDGWRRDRPIRPHRRITRPAGPPGQA